MKRGRLRSGFGGWVEGERPRVRGRGWYRGQRVFRLRDGVRATALHKVGREDGGRRRPQCAGRVSNLEPTIGLPTWYQERPGSAKIHRDGMYVGGRYASPCLFYLFFRLLFSYPSFFRPLPRRAKGGQAYIRSAVYVRVSMNGLSSFSYFFLCRPSCMHASRDHESTCLDDFTESLATMFSIDSLRLSWSGPL